VFSFLLFDVLFLRMKKIEGKEWVSVFKIDVQSIGSIKCRLPVMAAELTPQFPFCALHIYKITTYYSYFKNLL